MENINPSLGPSLQQSNRVKRTPIRACLVCIDKNRQLPGGRGKGVPNSHISGSREKSLPTPLEVDEEVANATTVDCDTCSSHAVIA